MTIPQYNINDISDLVNAATIAGLQFGNSSVWFRGHASTHYKLVPSIHRGGYDHLREANMAQMFRLYARSRHAACPHMDDVPAWLCLMQHYGLPTRLLDWTESPLVAGFFAVSHTNNPGDAAIWALNPGALNEPVAQSKNSIFNLSMKEVAPALIGAFNVNITSNNTIAVVSPEIDLRMLMQQGCFTIHPTDQPVEETIDAHRILTKFVIPESSKELLKHQLHIGGIRLSKLFPDLVNLAQELKTLYRAPDAATSNSAPIVSDASVDQRGISLVKINVSGESSDYSPVVQFANPLVSTPSIAAKDSGSLDTAAKVDP